VTEVNAGAAANDVASDETVSGEAVSQTAAVDAGLAKPSKRRANKSQSKSL